MKDTRFIPEFNWEPLQKYIEKAQKKATKLECGEITAELTGREEIRDERVNVGTDFTPQWEVIKVKWVEVTVKGETPSIEGWKLVGVLEHSDIGDLRYEVPGGPGIPAGYKKDHCDHCGYVRHRKWTCVIQETATGKFMQVGKSCIKDFLKISGSDPMKLIDRASWFMKMYADITIYTDLTNDELQARKEWHYEPLGPAVVYSYLLISDVGFVSRAKSRQEDEFGYSNGQLPTSHYVARMLWDKNDKYANELRAQYTWTDEVMTIAKKIVKDWSNKQTNGSDFENNCIAIARSGVMLAKHLGMVVAMTNSWIRDNTKKDEPETLDEHRPEEEGERINFRAYVILLKEIQHREFTSTLVLMKDEDGRKLTWFASSCGLDQGKWYNLRGTIKKKDFYRGEHSTIVTRVKEVVE